MAFALVLHLQLDDEKRHVLITSTLIIIMFTILCLGGSTLPLLKVSRLVDFVLLLGDWLKHGHCLYKEPWTGRAVSYGRQIQISEHQKFSIYCIRNEKQLNLKLFLLLQSV